jgi:hypothetical protein
MRPRAVWPASGPGNRWMRSHTQVGSKRSGSGPSLVRDLLWILDIPAFPQPLVFLLLMEGGTGGVSPQPPLHQMISYLHEFLQRHEISQRHLLATKEGPVFQEHVLQLPQKSIHTGPVAFHLGLNGCCSHLMVAEDGFSLYLHLFLGPWESNPFLDDSTNQGPQRHTKDATDIVSMPSQILMHLSMSLQVSWIPVVCHLVLTAQVTQDGHAGNGVGRSICKDTGSQTLPCPSGCLAYDGHCSSLNPYSQESPHTYQY